MVFFITHPLFRHRHELGYAVGLSIGFLQMLYLDYKIERNFQNQLKRIDDLNKQTDDLTIKVNDIMVRVENICKNQDGKVFKQ